MPRSREAQLPPHVHAALAPLLGEDVSGVRITEYSRFARLHGKAIATTRRGRIYLRGAANDFFANPWLMLHEYWHVLGQWRCGELTVTRYLLECARRGYWNNRFEVEARQFADRHSRQLHAALQLPTRSQGAASASQPPQSAQPG